MRRVRINQMPQLAIERFGQGLPMVFIHGWGMHRSLLRGFAQTFASRHAIWLVDLPGYGHSDLFDAGADVESLARYLAENLPVSQRYILVGWSMGASIALQLAASFPQRIAALILFTATPCFIATSGWSHGITQPALQQVSDELTQDYSRALNRFLQLQLKNTTDARTTVRAIRDLLANEPPPRAVALQQGLRLLAHTDLRDRLDAIDAATLIINGDRDSLVATLAARWLAEHLPRARAVILHGAGHLPFISHAEFCRRQIEEFLLEESIDDR
jgi:pimeloyl-[acyl-carrier protein] methyl ester esterase